MDYPSNDKKSRISYDKRKTSEVRDDKRKDIIHADGIDIGIYTSDYENEYISLTDIEKKREGEYSGYVIQNWMRNRSTISFIGLWEILYNPSFNCLEFEAIKMRHFYLLAN